MNTKLKIYTYATKYSFEDKFTISYGTYLPQTENERVVIPISDIEVNIPAVEVTQEQLVNGEIEQIKTLIKEEQEKSFRKQKFWEERIGNLQALESK